MVESFMYWKEQIYLFMIQHPFLWGWFCIVMGSLIQWLYERIIEKGVSK